MSIIGRIASFIYPEHCVRCGELVGDDRKSPFCERCGRMFENEKLREWEYDAVLMRRVCNNHIDPMNRYNEDYSLYCRVCLICAVLFARVALHSLSCGECRYSPTYPLFTSLFL